MILTIVILLDNSGLWLLETDGHATNKVIEEVHSLSCQILLLDNLVI